MNIMTFYTTLFVERQDGHPNPLTGRRHFFTRWKMAITAVIVVAVYVVEMSIL